MRTQPLPTGRIVNYTPYYKTPIILFMKRIGDPLEIIGLNEDNNSQSRRVTNYNYILTSIEWLGCLFY